MNVHAHSVVKSLKANSVTVDTHTQQRICVDCSARWFNTSRARSTQQRDWIMCRRDHTDEMTTVNDDHHAGTAVPVRYSTLNLSIFLTSF